MKMKIVLCAQDDNLAEAWQQECGGFDVVKIHHGSILNVDESDVVVSPANSFGFMDGGLDAVYMHHFGDDIQMKVRKQIYEYHHGELVVGNADIVETGNHQIPYVIVAPTMRVPMILHDSVNAYLAARAIFILCMHGHFKSGNNKGQKISSIVETVAIPGLGTGVGKIGAKVCAGQVRQAISDILYQKYIMPKSWAEASEDHQLLYTKKLNRLQY